MANNEDEIDDILSRGLSSYSDAEPLAGLEQRVLNRIASAPRDRSKSFLWWSAAVTAVLGLSIFVAIGLRVEQRGGETVARLHPPAAPHQNFLSERMAPKPKAKLAERRIQRPRSLQKQEQFPTPTPLTGEERALLAFAERHGTEAQKAFADLRERNSQPIVIPPIEIAAIQEDR